MWLKKIIALVSGLAVFVIIIALGILTINNPSPLYVALFGIAVAIFVPTGFELCRFAIRSGDKEYRFFSRGYRGTILDMAGMLLAICLMIATVSYQHPSRLLCYGGLGAGFPAVFICDASGESPMSSWGKIDWADLDSLNLPGSFVDILFYTLLVWVARYTLLIISQQRRRPSQ